MLEKQEKPSSLFVSWFIGKTDKQGKPKEQQEETTPEMCERLIALSSQIKDLQAAQKELQSKLLEVVDWQKNGKQVNTVHIGNFTVKREKLYNLSLPNEFDKEDFAEKHPEFVRLSTDNRNIAKYILETGDAMGLDKDGFHVGSSYTLKVAIQS